MVLSQESMKPGEAAFFDLDVTRSDGWVKQDGSTGVGRLNHWRIEGGVWAKPGADVPQPGERWVLVPLDEWLAMRDRAEESEG